MGEVTTCPQHGWFQNVNGCPEHRAPQIEFIRALFARKSAATPKGNKK